MIIGARNEQQLRDNLAAATWTLSDAEVERLDEVSAIPLPYPRWHQQKFAAERNPPAEARALGLADQQVAPPITGHNLPIIGPFKYVMTCYSYAADLTRDTDTFTRYPKAPSTRIKIARNAF